MNKGKKFTAAVAATAVASAMVAPIASASVQFSDIEGSYAKAAILELAEKGIIVGENGKFSPTANIKRQDFAIIMAKALNLDLTKAPATPTFSDVPANHYSYAAVEAAVKAGLLKGEGNGKFGLGTNLSREAMAVIFVNALGVDVAGKGAELKFADAASISSWAKDAVAFAVEAKLLSGDNNNKFNPLANAERQQVAVVASNFLKVQDDYAVGQLKNVEVTGATSLKINFTKAVEKIEASEVAVKEKATGNAVTVSAVALAEDGKSATVTVGALAADTTYVVSYKNKSAEVTNKLASIKEAKQAGAKKISVEFSSPLAADAKVVVKNGYLTVDGEVTFNEGRTVATFTSESALVGTYSVEVTGLAAAEVKAEAEKLESFEITTTELQAVATQDVNFTALNQFGEEFTLPHADFTATAYNATDAGTLVVAPGAKQGVYTINTDLSGAKDDAIVVTLVHVATGKSSTKTYKVIPAATVAKVTLAAPAPVKGTERITTNYDSIDDADTEKNLVLPITLNDQYGKELKLTDALLASGDFNIVSSDNAIVNPASFFVNEDGKLAFDTGAKAGNVTLTAVVPSAGYSQSVTFEVFAAGALNSVSISQPTGLIVAGEDTKLTYVAKDQFGKDVKLANAAQLNWFSSKDDVLDATDAGQLFVNAKGELIINPAGAGTTTLYAYLGGKVQASIQLTVKEAAVATKISGLSEKSFTKFAVGGAHTYGAADLVVLDQYGRTIDSDDLGGAVTVTKKDATKTAVTVAGTTVTGSTAGSQVLVFTYDGSVSKEITVTTIKQSDVVSYALDDVDSTHLFDGDYATETEASDDDATQAVKIAHGKDANGSKVAVETTLDALTTSNDAIVVVNKANGKVWAAENATEGGKATVTAWKDGKQVGTIEFTTSAKDPVATKVAFSKESLDVPTGVAANAISTLLTVKDQYGKTFAANGTWFSSNKDVLTVDAATGAIAVVESGTVTVTYVSVNGVNASITAKVTK